MTRAQLDALAAQHGQAQNEPARALPDHYPSKEWTAWARRRSSAKDAIYDAFPSLLALARKGLETALTCDACGQAHSETDLFIHCASCHSEMLNAAGELGSERSGLEAEQRTCDKCQHQFVEMAPSGLAHRKLCRRTRMNGIGFIVFAECSALGNFCGAFTTRPEAERGNT